MGHRQRIGSEADRGGRGGKRHITRRAGHAESHVQGTSSCVKDQRDVQQVAFAEQAAAAFGHSQQGDDQQKSYRQSNQDQQGISAGSCRLFHLDHSCSG